VLDPVTPEWSRERLPSPTPSSGSCSARCSASALRDHLPGIPRVSLHAYSVDHKVVPAFARQPLLFWSLLYLHEAAQGHWIYYQISRGDDRKLNAWEPCLPGRPPLTPRHRMAFEGCLAAAKRLSFGRSSSSCPDRALVNSKARWSDLHHAFAPLKIGNPSCLCDPGIGNINEGCILAVFSLAVITLLPA
jgi:hypothetical protein